MSNNLRSDLGRFAKSDHYELRHKHFSEYLAWKAMRNRCLSKNPILIKNYSGRGIIICERWLNSFENFMIDMGEKPKSEYTLERVNNDGNYEPNNCKWATWNEQRKNKRLKKPKMRDVLNQQEIIEICQLYFTKKYNQTDLAIKFNVSQVHISKIIKLNISKNYVGKDLFL
jgi:hypothetical protein